MKNVLFYGNCQVCPIHLILNLNPNDYNIIAIECFSTQVTKIELDNWIIQCDIIIMQPIHDNYREKDYLSSSYIILNSKRDCQIIFIDNCYFDFYYFDTTIKPFDNNHLWIPSLYHYVSLINCYKNNTSIEFYMNNFVNNYNLKNKNELENLALEGIQEFRNRYNNMLNYKQHYYEKNISCISIADYIENNYKHKLLFYTINHPTKYVLQYICEKIVDLLQINNSQINYHLDPLNYTKCIIYKCISQVITFSLEDKQPLLENENNLENIVKMYYNVYKNLQI
jgi:hypothetical protein